MVYLMIWAVYSSPAFAEDWPTFAHNNQRTSVTSERLPTPLHLQWEFRSPAPPAPGWSLPVNGYGARKNKSNVSYDDAFRVIAVGGVAYFCSSAENCLYAIDAKTGAIRWRFFTDAAPRLAPTFWEGNLYFGADDGFVYCVRAVDGNLTWRYNARLTGEKMLGYGRFSSVWPVRTSVMIEDEIAYFVSGLFPSEGIFFHALDAKSGKLKWRRPIDRKGNVSPQGYLLASNDSIFMTSRVAPTRWSKKDGSPISFSTPYPKVEKSHEYRFHNGGTYAQIWNGKHIVYGQACLLGYDPDKELRDKYNRVQNGDLIFNWFNGQRIVFRGDMAYLSTDFHVIGIEQSKLPDIAQNECREFEVLYKKLRVANRLELMDEYERLLAEHGEEHSKVREMKSGPLKWGQSNWDKWPAASKEVFAKIAKECRWMTPLNARESMVLAGDTLFVGSEEQVHAINTETGKVVWSARTGSRVRGLAVSNGHLFVSTVDGSVRCFGAQQQEPLFINHKARPLDGDQAAIFLKAGGWTKGHCLLIGDDGTLAYLLALKSDLTIQVVANNAENESKARNLLASTGFYGSRVNVEHFDTRTLPYPPYVFNLVIDLTSLETGKPSISLDEMIRVTRPVGGVTLVSKKAFPTKDVQIAGPFAKFQRGNLPGAQDWTHNYATAANTYSNEDQRVKGPFGVLWYGEPGPKKRIDRHAAAPIPLVANGIMFTQGYDLLMAYDIYNGVRYWERTIPGVTRSGLPIGTSNMVAGKEGLFVVVNDRECWLIDAESGETKRKYPTPPREGEKDNFWGWIARDKEMIYGSRVIPDTRRRGRADRKHSNEVFAIDIASGETKWRHRGKSIEHDGIAIGGDTLFLIDRVAASEAAAALRAIPKDTSVPDRDAKGTKPDLRKLVALNAGTGKVIFEKPFNATDITLDDTIIHRGRVAVACMYKDGVVVVHGTGSLGHPHREFLRGEFARRAIYAFDSRTGKFLWGGRRNYRKRPIIVGDHVFAEPFAWNLKTGKPMQVANPLTGEAQNIDLHRGYIGCNHLLASGVALFGNKAGIGYCNIDSREGFTPFAGLALGCGIVATPAGGVFVAPEGRSGCTCATPIHTSVVLYPRTHARAWGIGTSGGIEEVTSFPVKHAFVNLGAPGYREEAKGNLWLPYPSRVGTGLIGKWLPTYQHNESMFYSHPPEFLKITGTERPWLYTSGYTHDKELRFKLIDKGQPAATYTVRLHFAEPDELKAGDRVFSVMLQGKLALDRFDMVAETNKSRRAIVKEFRGITVSGELRIRLKSDLNRLPILCAFEAIRESGK